MTASRASHCLFDDDNFSNLLLNNNLKAMNTKLDPIKLAGAAIKNPFKPYAKPQRELEKSNETLYEH